MIKINWLRSLNLYFLIILDNRLKNDHKWQTIGLDALPKININDNIKILLSNKCEWHHLITVFYFLTFVTVNCIFLYLPK